LQSSLLAYDHPGFVMIKMRVGGTRVVDMLSGEQLPRIC
jgi:hydrogenase expression/formation protein HypE